MLPIEEAPQCREPAAPSTEYARVAEVQRLTGLKRNTLYRLLKAGKIKGAMLPVTGNKSGVRVFDMKSVRDFIQQNLNPATTT